MAKNDNDYYLLRIIYLICGAFIYTGLILGKKV